MQLILPGALAFLVSVALTMAMRRLAPRVGAVAVPKADRWHRTQIPLLGGAAIAAAVVTAAVVALYALALKLGQAKGRLSADEVRRRLAELAKVPDAVAVD